jgi:prophage regulatory protein
MQKQLLRLPQVREAVGLSRSEIYRLMSLRRFPAPVPLGERVVAWDHDEVQDWIRARIAARASKAPDARPAA